MGGQGCGRGRNIMRLEKSGKEKKEHEDGTRGSKKGKDEGRQQVYCERERGRKEKRIETNR